MRLLGRIILFGLSTIGLFVLVVLAFGVAARNGIPTGSYRSLNADGTLSESRRYLTPTPGRTSVSGSLNCTHEGGALVFAQAENEGRAAKGTIRNTCTQDVRVEYNLTGLDKNGHVLTGPVRRTEYLRANEVKPWYYTLYPDGRAWDMVLVRATVILIAPY